MTISALVVFALTWAGLALLQLPLALLSGLVCGLLTFVPTIGPTAATLLPLAVALLISPAKLVQVLILRLLLQNFEAFVLTPTATAPHRQPAANGGPDGPAQSRSPARLARRAAGPAADRGAAGDLPAGAGGAGDGSLEPARRLGIRDHLGSAWRRQSAGASSSTAMARGC